MTIFISKPSIQSLFIQMRINGNNLASGTGFIANSTKGPVLITNRHNVTGKNSDTGETLSQRGYTPDDIVIVHNISGNRSGWLPKIEPLYDDDFKPLWFEHPTLGAKADFVALPLTQINDIDLHPYALGNDEPKIKVAPSDVLSVVGFPFGLAGGGSLAIWATGFMASEPDVDFNDLPIFLIDCRSRPGQSGSAVIAQRNGGMVPLENGNSVGFSGPVTRFLGIYSGRINKESDLGIVWKATAIKELVDSIK